MNKVLIGLLSLALLQSCTSNSKKTPDAVNKYPAFNVHNMDTIIKPGDDFFAYTNGTWLKNNPIPPDKNSTNVFDELAERNRENIKEIIIEAASSKDSLPGSNKQKIGTFYNSGMDTVKIGEQDRVKFKDYC